MVWHGDYFVPWCGTRDDMMSWCGMVTILCHGVALMVMMMCRGIGTWSNQRIRLGVNLWLIVLGDDNYS